MVSIGTAMHSDEQCGCSNVVAARTPSSWDVWIEVKSCIALYQLHCIICIALGSYIYIAMKQLMSLLLCYLNLMLNQTLI